MVQIRVAAKCVCVCVCVTISTRIQHENWIIHTFTSIKVDQKNGLQYFLGDPSKACLEYAINILYKLCLSINIS